MGHETRNVRKAVGIYMGSEQRRKYRSGIQI